MLRGRNLRSLRAQFPSLASSLVCGTEAERGLWIVGMHLLAVRIAVISALQEWILKEMRKHNSEKEEYLENKQEK